MGAKQNYYTEDLSVVTPATTMYPTTKLTLPFTPDANSDYFLLWSAGVFFDVAINATRRPRMTLEEGSTMLHDQSNCPVKTGNYNNRGGAVVRSFGASPVETTYTVKYGKILEAGGAAGDLIGVKDNSLIAIKRGSNDQFFQGSTTGQAITSTSYVDLPTTPATLAFTPPSSGDYLLIAFAELTNTAASTATAAWGCQLNHTTATAIYGEAVSAARTIDGRQPWMAIAPRITLAASLQTFKIQVKSLAGTSVNVRATCIIAIRLSDLDNAYTAESATRTTTGSSTPQDKAVITATTQALNHFVIYSMNLDGSSLTEGDQPQAHLAYDDTSIKEANEAPSVITTYDGPYFGTRKINTTAAEHTFKAKFNSKGGVSTIGASDARIAVLQLDATAGGGGGTDPVGKQKIRTQAVNRAATF